MFIPIISIIEILYISYMFHFLETSVDFNIYDSPSNILFKHAVGNDKVKRICLFGQYAILILIIMILIRCCYTTPSNLVIISVCIALFISIINFNALVYLIPIFIVESYLYYSKINELSY